PFPFVFRDPSRLAVEIPLAFELADSVILLAGEFASHFDSERYAVERADAGGEARSSWSALTANGQIARGFRPDKHRVAGHRVFGFVNFVQIKFCSHGSSSSLILCIFCNFI